MARFLMAHLLRPIVALSLVLALSSLPCALAYTNLSDDSLRRVPAAGADFDVRRGALLAPILIPRVPDTPGSGKVQQHFADFFAEHLPGWALAWHNSTSTTPATGGRPVRFRSLVLRRDPPWAAPGDVARLTLAAHYDSLYRPEGFVGATDSAASCAVLMHVARSVDAALSGRWEAMRAAGEAGLEEDKGVQILLLDGEEAWVKWTEEDSTYGSRALAEAWENEAYPATSTYESPLRSISLFVLLDLLGAENPRVPSWFESTHWAYRHLVGIEERMRRLGLLDSRPPAPFLADAERDHFGSYVLDDHIPFLRRGVDVLHLIPHPFPGTWHTMLDDGAHLDGPALQDWARIVTAFVAEWMDLEGHLPLLGARKGRSEKEEL